MSRPNWKTCRNCGERWDASGRYTSPANHAKDLEWWAGHVEGRCEVSEPTPEQIEAGARAYDPEAWAVRDRLAAEEGASGAAVEAIVEYPIAVSRRVLAAAAAADTSDASEKPADLSIMNGWLVESVGKHTCGAGMDGYGHEPGCGYVPVLNLAELDGYRAQVDEAKLAEAMDAHSPSLDISTRGYRGECVCGEKVKDHDAHRVRKVAEWLRGGGR